MKTLIVTLLCVIQICVFSQNEEQEKIRRQILSKTDTVALRNLSIEFANRYQDSKQELIEWSNRTGYPIRTESSDGTVTFLRGFINGRPVYISTDNRIAAQTTSTDDVWGLSGFNLDGTGIEIGQWDGGAVYVDHNSFREGPYGQRHVYFLDPPGTGFDDHATHVAGTIVADNDEYYAKGMANESVLFSRDSENDLTEMTNASLGVDPNLSVPLILSNHSYGSIVGWHWGDLRNAGTDAWYWMAEDYQNEDPDFGSYNQLSFDFDQIAFNAPFYTIVMSAGNNRGEGPEPNAQHWVWNDQNQNWVTSTSYHPKDGGTDGFDCLPPDKVAKNIITVGAIDDIPYGYQSPYDVQQVNTDFSGWGPTKDGRIKPDIVANGDVLYSTLPNNLYGNTINGSPASGTSMAAPNVTGSLALLLQHYKNTHNNAVPLSSTLKAIVIHTADESGSSDGPDYKFGWGLLNTFKAAQLISEDQGNTTTIQECSLEVNGPAYTMDNLYSEGTQPIKITLAWNDIPPSNYQTGPILMHDLDVRLVKNSTTYYPWKLNPASPNSPAIQSDNTKDNVEQILFQSPGEGYYSVVVSHKGNLAFNQMFSLVVTGFISPFVTFNLKQIGYDDQPFGQAAYWENLMWNSVPPTQPVTLPIGDNHFLSTQEFRPSTYEKFNRWEDDILETDHWYLNWDIVSLSSNTNLVSSRFIPTTGGIIIKNSLEGTIASAGSIEFADPWLVDFNEPPYGYRSRGMDAPFFQKTSPFNPNYSSSHKGVFLDQPYTGNNPVYYSVKALGYQDINLGGQIGTRRFWFQNWSGTDVEFQDASSFETGVVFTSSNATASAVLKGVGLSNNQNGYGTGSQQKFVRLYYGTLFSIYTSLNKVWLEISENNGQSWDLWRNHIPYESNNEYSTPSIDWIPWTITHSFAAIVCGINAGPISSVLKVDVIRETQITPSYSENIGIVGSDHPRPPFTPVIAVTENEIMVVCNSGTEIVGSGEEGLVYFYGSISNPGGFTVNVSWVNKDNPLKIPGSTYNSKSPTIMADKDGNTFHIAWQEGNAIKYCNATVSGQNITFSTVLTPSSGCGYTQNYSPSILVMETDNIARLCWVGKRHICQIDPVTSDCAGISQYKVLFKGLNNLSRSWAFGGNNGNAVSSPNINKKNNNTIDPYYAFAWYESSGENKFADNTLSTVRTLNTTGQRVQVVNGQDKENMYAMSFNYSSSPYYFLMSDDLGSFYSMEKNQYNAFTSGREGIVSVDSAEFYFAIGDIEVDGQPVDFVEITDTVPVNNLTILNQYLVSQPVSVNDNSSFIYSVQYGINDSLSAVQAMVDDRFVNYKVQLLDANTGEVIGEYDDITYNAENIYDYGNISYQVNTQGIGNRMVRLKLVVNNNFVSGYSLTKIYSDESALYKSGVKQINFTGNKKVTSYTLSQNYPNPFNPSTTIKYEIPEGGLVTLKVYDILGSEIATLVNEEKSTGRYEVNFDASLLSSGVYIYRLNVNDYVSVKKMVLLK